MPCWSTPFLPDMLQLGPAGGPGISTALPLVPMSELITPMWRFGAPPSIVASSARNAGNAVVSAACLSAIEPESSITNSRSRSGFGAALIDRTSLRSVGSGGSNSTGSQPARQPANRMVRRFMVMEGASSNACATITTWRAVQRFSHAVKTRTTVS